MNGRTNGHGQIDAVIDPDQDLKYFTASFRT